MSPIARDLPAPSDEQDPMSRACPGPTRRPGPVRRRGPAAVVLLALVAALLALSAGPASAHDELVGTDPADGATVAALPARVTATWSEAPDGRFATVTVVGADGTHFESGPATVEGERIVVPVRPGPAGRYEIGYRVVSDDGHPVTGSVSFTATGTSGGATVPSAAGTPGSIAGSGTPDTAAASPSNAASSAPAGSDGVPVWAIVLAAVVVIGGAVALTLRRRV